MFVGTFLVVLSLVFAAVPPQGVASWYDDGPGLYAAVHSYEWGDPRYKLEVCRADNLEVCVTVTVRDHCQCYVGERRERAIDLSPSAFKRLAPLSAGLVRVVLRQPGDKPSPTLPPTDSSPRWTWWSFAPWSLKERR